MQAAVLTGPGTLVMRELEKPSCGETDILIKVKACGICGSDVRNYHAGLRGNVEEQIMGHEIAGIVEEVGRAWSDSFYVGQRLAIAPDVSCGTCYYCLRGLVNLCAAHRMIGTHWPGGFAEYIQLNETILARGMVHPIPEGVGFDEATLAEPAASVLASQHDANIGLGDTVVVIGDGPIGCLHLEVARARGASKVIMVGLDRLAFAERFEPDHLIDAASQDPVSEVMRITNGFGADAAIAANPVAETQAQGVEMVRKRGQVILFGGLPKQKPMTTINSNLIHYNELIIRGSFSYPAAMHKLGLELIATGKIRAAKYITKTVSLAELPQAIADLKEGRALKIVVHP